jgi:hypothetical protein
MWRQHRFSGHVKIRLLSHRIIESVLLAYQLGVYAVKQTTLFPRPGCIYPTNVYALAP